MVRGSIDAGARVGQGGKRLIMERSRGQASDQWHGTPRPAQDTEC